MSVRRFDRGELAKPSRTPEGWLLVEGNLSRVGVFTYRNADGTERRELRLPDEVFKADHLDSLKLRPITLDHPPEFLSSTNARRYSVGALGETITRSGDYLSGRMLVTDCDAIAAIEGGARRQISLGYHCELEMVPGVTATGERYDCIQRNIRANHVALVEVGRAGPGAALRMDATDAVQVTPGETPPPPPKAKETPMKVRVNGVDFEASPELAQALGVMSADQDAEVDKLEKEAATLKADSAKLQAKLDAAEEKVKEAEKARKDAEDPARVRELAKARASLEVAGAKHLGKEAKLDTLDDDAIRRAVILKAYPERKLDGRSADYLQAAYESAVEKLDAESAPDEKGKGLAAARAAGARADAGTDDPVKAARAKMLEESQSAWKRPMKGTTEKSA